jgi:uncharacterized protein YciI
MYFVITHHFVKENITESDMTPHVQYLKQLLDNGKLIITGPFLDKRKGGMFIVEVDNEEELNSIVENDPAITSGFSTSEVRPYKIVFKR